MLPQLVSAYDFKVDRLCYDFNYDSTSVIVTYEIYYNEHGNGYYNLFGDLIIPSSVTYNGINYPVTEIGSEAFLDCSGLTSVIIPNSVTEIGYYAFDNCTSLTSLTIGNSVTEIYGGAFNGCYNLASVTLNSNALVSKDYYYSPFLESFGSQVKDYIIGEEVTRIGNNTFADCSGLASVTIPNSVTEIGSGAFMNCSGMTSINSKIKAPQNVDYGSNVFTSIDYSTCCVYVPYGTRSLYEATSPWSEFEHIIEVSHEIEGDVDGDGNVTAADVTEIYNFLLNGSTNYHNGLDVDGDGFVTANDVTAIYNILLKN